LERNILPLPSKSKPMLAMKIIFIRNLRLYPTSTFSMGSPLLLNEALPMNQWKLMKSIQYALDALNSKKQSRTSQFPRLRSWEYGRSCMHSSMNVWQTAHTSTSKEP
jgi:hypothetical protein